jgi:hypothetical protein
MSLRDADPPGSLASQIVWRAGLVDKRLREKRISAASAAWRVDMLTYEVFIDDDRYSVPTLLLINAETEARACAHAETLLQESPHHRGVELRRDGARVFGTGSFADPTPTD